MPRYLYVVSRRDPALFEFLKARFADDENVEVILDRRADPAPPGPAPPVERRVRAEVAEEIRVRSYAVITLL
jgi:hypothetical protein